MSRRALAFQAEGTAEGGQARHVRAGWLDSGRGRATAPESQATECLWWLVLVAQLADEVSWVILLTSILKSKTSAPQTASSVR
jgi:hypothetical protein